MVSRFQSGLALAAFIFMSILIAGLVTAPIQARVVAAQESEADALLVQSATAMADVESFHFEITTPRGETALSENLAIIAISGDVQRPDRFQAVATVDAMIAQLELTIIGVGDRIWMTDPLSADESFIELEMDLDDIDGAPSMADLVNPDRLLLTSVEAVQDATIAGEEEVGGVMTTRVNGVAVLDALGDDYGNSSPIADGALAGEPVQVAVWIDEDYRVRRLDVHGRLLEAEAPNTVRRLELSAFDEPVEIEPPGQ